MMEPRVVNAASFGMLAGLSIENVIRNISFTSGNDKNDESNMAKTMSPVPPYGSSVAFSHTEIASNNGID